MHALVLDARAAQESVRLVVLETMTQLVVAAAQLIAVGHVVLVAIAQDARAVPVFVLVALIVLALAMAVLDVMVVARLAAAEDVLVDVMVVAPLAALVVVVVVVTLVLERHMVLLKVDIKKENKNI